MSTASAPIEIGQISLTVHDLPRVAAFYRDILGLAELHGDAGSVALGVGGRVLVTLRADPAARKATGHEAGLFHTAFLLPSRADLGAWLIHAADSGVRLQGASDHLVSEALYLADPEGNGVEVYADRPRSAWHDATGAIRMATERLDLQALAQAARAPWRHAPEGAVVGHVHLQVGALDASAAFCTKAIGMPAMARYPGASFHGSGGYHHHIAVNVWNSRNAPARALPATGLAEVTLLADPQALTALGHPATGISLTDPSGIALTLRPKAS